MIKRLLYLHFQFIHALKEWFGKRFTLTGGLVMGGLVVSAALGIDTNRTMAYQIFTFLLSLLLFSTVIGLFQSRIHQDGVGREPVGGENPGGLFSVNRLLPRFGMAGEPLTYRMRIHNHTNKIQEGLYITENLSNPCPSLEEFIDNTEPYEATRNWFDRRVGYYRWQWLISQKQGAVVKEQPLPPLPPGEGIELRLEMTPLRRGRLQFTGVTLARLDPFGLFRSLDVFPASQSLLILPRRYAFPPIKLGGGRKFQQGGVTLASKVGDSEEFMSLRNYRPGDPLHRIHWKSWARTGKPVIKEYQEEFFVRYALIMDTFLKTDYSDVFEEAVSLAASFVCSFKTEESLLDLMFMGTEAYCFTSGRGITHQDRMMEILASVKVCKDKPFNALHRVVRERIGSLSGCVCILLSWDEQRQSLVRDLRSHGISVLVLLVTESDTPRLAELGPMEDQPKFFHQLEAGKIAEGLANL